MPLTYVWAFGFVGFILFFASLGVEASRLTGRRENGGAGGASWVSLSMIYTHKIIRIHIWFPAPYNPQSSQSFMLSILWSYHHPYHPLYDPYRRSPSISIWKVPWLIRGGTHKKHFHFSICSFFYRLVERQSVQWTKGFLTLLEFKGDEAERNSREILLISWGGLLISYPFQGETVGVMLKIVKAGWLIVGKIICKLWFYCQNYMGCWKISTWARCGTLNQTGMQNCSVFHGSDRRFFMVLQTALQGYQIGFRKFPLWKISVEDVCKICLTGSF